MAAEACLRRCRMRFDIESGWGLGIGSGSLSMIGWLVVLLPGR